MNSIDVLNGLKITKDSRVLFIYPHPDDETFYSFGLIFSSLKIGANVKVVCLTKGGASTLRYGLKNENELMDEREKEFKKVMELLNLKNYELLDFPDGSLTSNQVQVENYAKNLLQKENFTHIVTFEPNGGYGHPDHKLISKVITNLHTEKKNFVLIYATYGDFMKKFKKLEFIKANVKLSLDLATYFRKLKAISYHRTQFSPALKPKHLMLRLFAKNEYFCVK